MYCIGLCVTITFVRQERFRKLRCVMIGEELTADQAKTKLESVVNGNRGKVKNVNFPGPKKL